MSTLSVPRQTASGAERRSHWVLDFGILLILACILVFPLFRLKYLDKWSSIESTFIADGRALQENWPHHLWQPLWYCGTRADYVYPPGLRMGVAGLSALFHLSQARAYHMFIGIFYAFGLAAMYLWARAGSRSRLSGWLAAFGVALLSPCFLVIPDLAADSGFLVPWRLHVLMTYGEGPHISSLSVIPLVWLGAWRRFHGGSLAWLALSAIAAAVAVTINFYGATTIAITFPLLVWACYLERWDWRILRDAALIGALAYGLTAWWLVPSFLVITSRNLHLVSPEGNSWSLPVAALIVAAYVAASFWIRRSQRFSPYLFFVASAFWFLAVYVLGYRWFKLQISGSSHRLIPELDVFAILLGVEAIRKLLQWRPQGLPLWAPRAVAAVALAGCLWPIAHYMRHVYFEFPKDPKWQERIEYRTAEWLQRNVPNERVFVAGSMRFWYNVWHNGQQADGGSMQGILNPLMIPAEWQIIHPDNTDLALHWLQALGVDVIVVAGPNSQEIYKDFVNPRAYDGHLPLLRDDGEGNRYYRVPRLDSGIVRMVDRARLEAAPAIPPQSEAAALAAYVSALEATPPGGDPRGRAQAQWKGSDALEVNVEARPGETLLVQESYDPYWRAYVDGNSIPIRKDGLGFMLLAVPTGRHTVHLTFETPLEMTVGRVLAILSLGAAAVLLFRRRAALA